MSHSAIESTLTALLRQKVLSGSDRDIDVAAPLGEQGLGLDSLGLVEFMVAVEKRFRIEIPETFWYTKDRASVRDIAGVVRELADESVIAEQQAVPIVDVAGTLGKEISLAVRIRRRLARAFRYFWRREKFFILRFDLTRAIPQLTTPLSYTFRRGTIEDLSIRWKRVDDATEARRMRLYAKRLNEGQICLVAFHDTELVARDWISATGDIEPTAPLRVRMLSGSCYGFDLNENPKYQGKGAGLALLRYSLEESKRLGFARQFTIVRDHNEKMLVASRQLIGYESAGTAVFLRVLGFARVSWEIDGRSGGGEIRL